MLKYIILSTTILFLIFHPDEYNKKKEKKERKGKERKEKKMLDGGTLQQGSWQDGRPLALSSVGL